MQSIFKKLNSISGGLKFFAVVALLYILLLFSNTQLAQQAFLNFLQIFFKIFPLLMVVFVFMVATNLYITEEKTKKYFGEGSGIKGYFYAIISGILIAGPPYVLYPMLGELKNKGVKNSLLAVFLYNRNVKLAFLPALIYYFGAEYTVVLSFYIILFSIINGLIIQRLIKE